MNVTTSALQKLTECVFGTLQDSVLIDFFIFRLHFPLLTTIENWQFGCLNNLVNWELSNMSCSIFEEL